MLLLEVISGEVGPWPWELQPGRAILAQIRGCPLGLPLWERFPGTHPAAALPWSRLAQGFRKKLG